MKRIWATRITRYGNNEWGKRKYMKQNETNKCGLGAYIKEIQGWMDAVTKKRSWKECST
jgi:hypothetical protein